MTPQDTATTPQQGTTKRFALKCWSSDSDYNADFDYALVEINQALRATIARRRKMYQDLRAGDTNLDVIRFHDYTPDFFSLEDLYDWDDKTNGPNPPSTYDDLAGLQSMIFGKEAEVAEAEPSFVLAEERRDFYSVYDKMEIGATGIRWTSSPRNSEINIETAELSYEILSAAFPPKPVPVIFLLDDSGEALETHWYCSDACRAKGNPVDGSEALEWPGKFAYGDSADNQPAIICESCGVILSEVTNV